MNLHPALSHSAPLLLGLALIAELIALKFDTPRWRSYSAQSLVFAAILSPLSYLTGYLASENTDRTFQVANEFIIQHQSSAKLLLFALFATICLRVAEHFAEHKLGFRIFYSLLLLVSTLLAVNTGYKGGSLVYQHGAGVSATPSK